MGRAKAGEYNDWSRYDREVKEFTTLEDIKEYLKDQYFYSKTKYKMFRDGRQGDPEQVGWIYAFKSGYGNEHWFEQHWIEIQQHNFIKPVLI